MYDAQAQAICIQMFLSSPSSASLVLFDVFVVFFLLAAGHDSLCYE